MANKQIQDEHADELSASRYTFKKLRESVITIGSTFGGVLLGGKIGGMLSHGQSLPGFYPVAKGIPIIGGKIYNVKQTIGGFAGGMIGMLVGGLVIGYEHWRKVETQRIAVDEINKDIASTVAPQPVDQELVIENKRLREMLESRSKSHAEGHHPKTAHAEGHHAKTHAEHAETTGERALG